MSIAETTRQIRRRLIWLILRAFVGVTLLSTLLLFAATALAIDNSLAIPPLDRLPILSRLEGYYLAAGSWEGAQAALATDTFSSRVTLVDARRVIILDHGRSDSPQVGVPYRPQLHEISVPIQVNGQTVGTLIYDRESVPSQLPVTLTILQPAVLVGAFLLLLATALVILLSQRVVAPLAEVIAAARAVAAGRLDARVQPRGPQDLLALTDSFNQMAGALERGDRERRELLADIAHELRTPLTALRGRLEGMIDCVYPADGEHISLALKASHLLERLVEDLRLLTLAESRQLTFDLQSVSLTALAAHSVELLHAQASENNITLSLDSSSQPVIILADAQRTEQVIGNLIGNALRYVPAGGQVWLSVALKPGWGELRVNDSGPGIPAEDLPYIFERFWRKDKSRARHSGGSGLGLAIVKQLVEAQGGQVAAENLPQGGLSVSVRLPAAYLPQRPE